MCYVRFHRSRQCRREGCVQFVRWEPGVLQDPARLLAFIMRALWCYLWAPHCGLGTVPILCIFLQTEHQHLSGIIHVYLGISQMRHFSRHQMGTLVQFWAISLRQWLQPYQRQNKLAGLEATFGQKSAQRPLTEQLTGVQCRADSIANENTKLNYTGENNIDWIILHTLLHFMSIMWT